MDRMSWSTPSDLSVRWPNSASASLLNGEFDLPDPATFRGSIVARPFADLTFIEIAMDKHSSYRSTAHIKSPRDAYYMVTLQLSGLFTIRQGGRTAVLSPGHFCVWTSSIPATTESSDNCRNLCVKLPHRLLHVPEERMQQNIVRALDAEAGLAPAVWSMLTTLNRTMHSVANAHRYSAVRGVVDMIEAVLDPPESTRATASPRAEMMCRISEFVDANLGSQDLVPQSIADAHFISVRHLHDLFEDTGTSVSKLVRDRRIEHCKAELTDPSLLMVPVSAIARRWGFRSASHFGQIFKTTTGSSPAEFRATAIDRGRTSVSSSPSSRLNIHV